MNIDKETENPKVIEYVFVDAPKEKEVNVEEDCQENRPKEKEVNVEDDCPENRHSQDEISSEEDSERYLLINVFRNQFFSS